MPLSPKKSWYQKLKNLSKSIGPGFITGASDDDPAGITTYTQTGAQFGLAQTWLALFSWPLMVAVQEMCGRIGMVTGKGLAAVLCSQFSKPVVSLLLFCLLFANVVNLGANLGAMSSVTQGLMGGNFLVILVGLVIFTSVSLTVLPYATYAKVLQILTISLFAYIAVVILVVTDWVPVLQSVIHPQLQLSQAFLLNIVAFLGTTISPYLFFWQAGQEVEEEIASHTIRRFGIIPIVHRGDMRKLRADTVLGMGFSNIISFCIVVAAASTLYGSGLTQIQSADQAARALLPIAGQHAYLLFALGVIGTGLLAVPVLAGSAAYALSELFGWKEGLYQKVGKAPAFYAAIALLIAAGALINLLPIEPFQMLYISAVINGLCAPILLFAILKVANAKHIMGKRRNGVLSNIFSAGTAALMSAAALFLLWITFFSR